MTTQRTSRPAHTAAVAVLGAGLVVASLTGCSMIEQSMPEQQRHYASYTDAPSKATSQDAAWFMPTWVPRDAEDIDVRLDTSNPGYVIAFSSEDGVDTAACTPVEGTHGGPAMTAGFLPESLPTTDLVTCGDGRITAEIDGRWYGWTPEEPVSSDADDTLRTP
ncbi:hypothetical protein [Curtobacterium sp. 9128]|uniref:hypothetical protein n=1 Tax=Curtobacterium sp. 9128 TaxID=1793722 RepID=UPI0011AAEEBC|nr:hypothetical protein [Curtobacterium sp. 9128]